MNQNVLDAHGPAAAEIAQLSWVLFVGALVIFAGVIALAAFALRARPSRRAWLAHPAFVPLAGAVFPVVVLTLLLVYALAPSAREAAADRIEVIGEQWWWRVHYLDANGARIFETANEIRIPAGRTVELVLTSADVIHSFWVPSLAGKLDMIPGRVNRMPVSADRPGRFRGQCAEFCGGPHARMALFVVALPSEEYEAWRAHQQRPADRPATAEAQCGERRFAERGCAVCHRVAGTEAAGRRGPDLTHVATRESLAAATLGNGPSALAAWVRDGQSVKPGNLMPSYHMLPSDEVDDLAAYLAALR